MPNKTDYLTHLDDAGQAHIVDISDKAITTRVATATSCLRMQPETPVSYTHLRAHET